MWTQSSRAQNPPSAGNKKLFIILWALVFLVALYFRMSGLFRGLGGQGSIFHPDEAKQVMALFNFLNGDYVRYYGSLFYDGYPYGLNHLDEYLLRPLLFFLGQDFSDHFPLYYYARLLRVIYGMITIVSCFLLINRLTRDRYMALAGMLLLALSPLSITVTHFATGDIGVDLFTACCLLCLVLYAEGARKTAWMLAAGITVGGAFSAKYNGLLLGMVPGMVLIFEYLRQHSARLFVLRLSVLLCGVVAGTILFTPNFLLDFKPTLGNMLANFQFIKNYNIPAEILAKPWFERTMLGLRNNTLYTIASLGSVAVAASLAGLLVALRQGRAGSPYADDPDPASRHLVLSLALFPFLYLVIALTGKYSVQPFHFSALQLPVIIAACFLCSRLRESPHLILRGASLLILGLILFEFGRPSWRENFFWRLEDNVYLEQNLPASLYDAEAFYSHRSGKIRSFYLEPAGTSVFRNRKLEAKGPDSHFWNTLEVAPLPQVPNPVGNDWIFLNGPAFPRNERSIVIHGEGHGKTVRRYLVLPTGRDWPILGIRSGSFPTEAVIDFGGATATVSLEAHQQKTVDLEPRKWRTSNGLTPDDDKVLIIPLEISVPHNDVWLTVLTTRKEKELFTLFGGGQENPAAVPEPVPAELQETYADALSRIRFMDLSLSWRVQDAKRIPMWEFALPAGRYTLITEVDGLVDESEISIELEDAKGELYRQEKRSFRIGKGIQRIEYRFTKAFVPYQGRFVVTSISGRCQILSFKLLPDHRSIAEDFERWREEGVRPVWVARYRE